MKLRRKGDIFKIFIAIYFLSFWLLGMYWFFWPYKVIEIKNNPYPVITKQIKAGEALVFHASYCIRISAPAQINQYFQDDILVLLAPKEFRANVGCVDKNFSIITPPNLLPGKYSLHTVSSYQVNPIRTIKYTSQTEEFEIIK